MNKEMIENIYGMKDGMDYAICRTQEDIYKYMVQEGYDIKVFSEAYLSCDFCRRAMDTIYSRFQMEFPNECADFFMPEIESLLVKANGENKFAECAGDIGFMYRLLYIETSVPSAELAKRVPFDKIALMVPSFSRYGYKKMADGIIEAFDLPRKRYDSDHVPLTKQEMEEMEQEMLREHQELEMKCFGEVRTMTFADMHNILAKERANGAER